MASKLYRQVETSPPQYLEGLELLTCSYQQSIPSFWTILEKTCGSGPANVRGALQHCVESTRIPSEYAFLADELNVRQNADFIDIFYGMRNHFAHEKNKIARGRLIPPETHTIVKRLAQLLCWSKVLADVDVKCLLWQEARVSFADWDFAQHEGQPTTLNKFQADGTYNALAAMRRLLRGGETHDERLHTLRHRKEQWYSAKLQIGQGKCRRDSTQGRDLPPIVVPPVMLQA